MDRWIQCMGYKVKVLPNSGQLRHYHHDYATHTAPHRTAPHHSQIECLSSFSVLYYPSSISKSKSQVLNCTSLYWTAPFCAVPYRTEMRTVLNCTVLLFTVPNFIVLYRIAPYYTAPYCNVLYCTAHSLRDPLPFLSYLTSHLPLLAPSGEQTWNPQQDKPLNRRVVKWASERNALGGRLPTARSCGNRCTEDKGEHWGVETVMIDFLCAACNGVCFPLTGCG